MPSATQSTLSASDSGREDPAGMAQHLHLPASLGASRQTTVTPFERFAMKRSETEMNVMAGGSAGFVSGVVTCPLDVIKTKLQAQGGFRPQAGQSVDAIYHGMLGTARVIWREEGIRGMYRGLGPIVLGYLPTWSVWFVVYQNSKDYLTGHNHNVNFVNFVSSIVAGASSTMVTNPIWVIKTRMMSQVSRQSSSKAARPPWHYNSTLDAIKKMYRTEGLRSFYSGLTPALLGLSHVAVQFPAYEYLKTRFTGQGMGVHESGDNANHYLGVIGASFLSKLLASAATYPHEVIRTRLQTQQRAPTHHSNSNRINASGQAARGTAMSELVPPARYKGVVMTFQTILREEGWTAFYSGLGTNLIRAIPAAMTTMLTYEYVMKHLKTGSADGRRKEAEM